MGDDAQNPKFEIRMTNQIRMTKLETNTAKSSRICFVIWISDLIRHSSFVIRISTIDSNSGS